MAYELAIPGGLHLGITLGSNNKYVLCVKKNFKILMCMYLIAMNTDISTGTINNAPNLWCSMLEPLF